MYLHARNNKRGLQYYSYINVGGIHIVRSLHSLNLLQLHTSKVICYMDQCVTYSHVTSVLQEKTVLPQASKHFCASVHPPNFDKVHKILHVTAYHVKFLCGESKASLFHSLHCC